MWYSTDEVFGLCACASSRRDVTKFAAVFRQRKTPDARDLPTIYLIILFMLFRAFTRKCFYFSRRAAITLCIIKHAKLNAFFSPRFVVGNAFRSRAAEMNFAGSQYYTLNRVMLSSVGLWPYQNMWFVRIHRFVCLLFCASIIVVQVIVKHEFFSFFTESEVIIQNLVPCCVIFYLFILCYVTSCTITFCIEQLFSYSRSPRSSTVWIFCSRFCRTRFPVALSFSSTLRIGWRWIR